MIHVQWGHYITWLKFMWLKSPPVQQKQIGKVGLPCNVVTIALGRVWHGTRAGGSNRTGLCLSTTLNDFELS